MTALTRSYRVWCRLYLDQLKAQYPTDEPESRVAMDTILPPEIWRKIIGEAFPHASNFPVYYAEFRAIIARVCKLWRFRLYSDQSFWSYIGLNQHVLSESLDFVLAKCPTVMLAIQISLLDVDTHYNVSSSEEPLAAMLSRIISKISPTSPRWRSFFFITEHPGAYMLVNCHLHSLHVPNLRTFATHYTLMEGYSNYDASDPIYLEPVKLLTLFDGDLSALTGVETCGVRIPRSIASLASNLVTFNVSQGYSTSLFTWEFLVELFSSATCLRHLKLADFAGVDVPTQGSRALSLVSASLRVLDLTVDTDGFAFSFMRFMDFPNIHDLTLRVDCTNAVESMRPFLPKFRPVRRFCLHGSLGYDDNFYPVFDAMPLLQILDLQQADEHTFIAYCGWSYLREFELGEDGGHNLVSLSVGMADVSDLVQLVKLHGGSSDSPGTRMQIYHVRMDHHIAVWDVQNYAWLLMSVEIDLDMGFSGDVYDDSGLAPYGDIIPCLQHAASTSSQWHTLTLYLNSGYLMDPIFLVLNSLHVVNLVNFEFQCPYLTGGVRFHFFCPASIPVQRHHSLAPVAVLDMHLYPLDGLIFLQSG
ncbi:hypothetical protein C8F04DRAFT_1266819 [Mycena alexandri]|uniref:F-box domain-containing protein n=1 Tax=Mycena alexandri TaxID=1745969 RepID=A0AAD6SGJ1_9AGAR|nr:hypothetical protein C8F04DRAFT_1266819 [Mycena alexandri]